MQPPYQKADILLQTGQGEAAETTLSAIQEAFTFEFTILAGEKASVRLINAMGHSVADIPLSPQAGLKEWDISGLAEGVYWYQLWIDSKPGPVGNLSIQH